MKTRPLFLLIMALCSPACFGQDQTDDAFQNLNEIVLVERTLGTEGYWDYDRAQLDEDWLARLQEIEDRDLVHKTLIEKLAEPDSTIGAVRVLNALHPDKAVDFHLFGADGKLIHVSIPLTTKSGETVMTTVSPATFRSMAKKVWQAQLFPADSAAEELQRVLGKRVKER